MLYGSIGISAALVFFLALYWSLRINSNISSFMANTYDQLLYFWPYVILTFAAVILFGINAALFMYRWRKFGPPKLKKQGATGAGSFVGVAASACPVCGSALLSAIGIAGGLAAFPLGGLELKALSVGFLALPIWLTRRDIKKFECGDGTCPIPNDHTYKESDRLGLISFMTTVVVLGFVSWNMLKTEPVIAKALSGGSVSQTGNRLIDEVTAKVLPEKGFQSKITLGDSIVKLAQNGVIDREKFLAIYQDPEGVALRPYGAGRGGLPSELKDVLDNASSKPILLTRQNANYYVNLLWPLGLANYMSSNKESPINGKSLFNFASTGGWDLGKEENGGAYFNKFKIVELTPEQEALATKIAQNTYRPCCNNSTFYQDCNHGSALLGLLQFGAAQGLSEAELYREVLAFNSFWFPQNYIQTALYLKAVKNTNWEKVDPKEVMGKVYSSANGAGLVAAKINELGLVPQQRGDGSCGV